MLITVAVLGVVFLWGLSHSGYHDWYIPVCCSVLLFVPLGPWPRLIKAGTLNLLYVHVAYPVTYSL